MSANWSDGYEVVHGAANSAPIWTWDDFSASVRKIIVGMFSPRLFW